MIPPFISVWSNKRAASSFVPTELPGLTLWLDASDASTVSTDFLGVTSWQDKSGNGNNASGSGPLSTLPGYSLNAINNLNACQMGFGYFNCGPASDLIDADTAYMFVSFKPTGLEDPGENIFNASAIIGRAGSSSDIGIFVNSELSTFGYNDDGTPDYIEGVADAGVSSIFSFTHSDGNISAAVDLEALASTASGDTLDISTAMFIGTTSISAFNAPQNAFRGLVGEVIVGNGVLTETQINQVRTYLYNKWKEQIPEDVTFYADESGKIYYSKNYELYTPEE